MKLITSRVSARIKKARPGVFALTFIFGPLRSVPMGVRVVTGISFGFIFYVLDQIFGPLTLVYGIPPIIGALLPSASFFLISLWLMMRKA